MSHAYAPGHVTGLFAVHDQAQALAEKGSRGAGWCLERGAYASVEERAGATRVTTQAGDGFPVTEDALQRMGAGEGFEVRLRLDLPVGQGFGMSAAGSLAACLAVADVQGRDPEEALAATHDAEVAHGTGLGDAIGSWFGGGELRIKPGCPPHGWAMQVQTPEHHGFLFCVLDGGLSTSRILADPEWRERTRTLGDGAVDRILDAGRERAWQAMLGESSVFSHRLGLMPADMIGLGKRLPSGIRWGQCMLGSTMWITGAGGDLDRAAAILEGHGQLLRARVDPNGARLVRQVPGLS